MKKNLELFILFIILLLLILCIFNSELIIDCMINYTILFFKKLFPTTFLFFMFSNLLVEYHFIEFISRVLHKNGSTLYVLLMSLLSGFPSGSKYTVDLYNKKLISLGSANYLIKFTHFPNPLFIMGVVSKIVGYRLAFIILISLIISNIIIMIVFKPKNSDDFCISVNTGNNSFSNNLVNSSRKALEVILNIYVTSIFFYLISVIINNYSSSNLYFFVLINGFFDLTSGINVVSLIPNNLTKCFYILLFFSIGSFSIHSQIKSIISNTPLNYYSFLIGRIIQLLLSSSIFYLVYCIIIKINWGNYIYAIFIT